MNVIGRMKVDIPMGRRSYLSAIATLKNGAEYEIRGLIDGDFHITEIALFEMEFEGHQAFGGLFVGSEGSLASLKNVKATKRTTHEQQEDLT